MAKGKICLSRALNTQSLPGLRILDCVGWPDPVGGMAFRLFCATGSDIRPLRAASDDISLIEARAVNGGAILSGTIAGQARSVSLRYRETIFEVPIEAPETELFEGLNCCICDWNGEPLEQLEAWLSYHVARFDLQALLLLDRGKSRKGKELERDLEAVAQRTGLTRLLRVTSDLPLGGESEPAAYHPIHAPDAPGKDRMTDLSPDPWAAPLQELQLYEWAKWRFLSRARAVMNIDLSDLLQPESDPFAQVHDTTHGVLQLLGQRIYPWRVRARDRVSFGDHICHPFETTRANRRWCVAPARLRAENIWRFVRIVDAPSNQKETAGFWRAMGMRHPDSAPAEIVPKTSLILNDTLLEMAHETWDHAPVLPPENAVQSAPGPAAKSGRTLIVTCMKNEGPFILEWVAYHRAIGVDDFLIYTNDCDDGTDELLDLLAERGLVQRRDNRFHGTGVKPQHWALAAAEKEPVLQEADWIISMDVDEFINIHTGEGHLRDLYAAIGEANMIALTWRLFGNNDVDAFEDRFIIEQFTRCAPELCRKPHQAWGFKTLFRNIGIYRKMGVHRPKGLKPDLWDQIRWVNGSGQPMPRKLIRNGWRSSLDSYGYALVTLNHYAARSAESFLVKRDRGRVNHVDRDQGLSYWFRMNNNWEEDHSIQTKLPLLRAELDRLLADPQIAAAHATCVCRHRARIAELKAQADYAAFHTELTGERMRRLSRMHTHFGANVFLAGPQSVPDEVAFREDLPENFFFTVERAKTTH